MSAIRACGNVPPATSSLFPALYAYTLTHKLNMSAYGLCTCTGTSCTHTHTYKQTSKDICSCPAGRCQAPGTSKPRTSLPQVCFLFGWAGGMSEASSGSGSPQSSTGLSNRKKVMEESCGDVCVCIPTEKTLPKGHTIDFCGLTNLILPKNEKNK